MKLNNTVDFNPSNQKNNYLWLILPEDHHLTILPDIFSYILEIKKKINDLNKITNSQSFQTKTAKQEFKVIFKFENQDYTSEYECSSNFTLVEFQFKGNTTKECALIRVKKQGNLFKPFGVFFETQKSKLLLFSDLDKQKTTDLHFLEKQVLFINASFTNIKMIPHIKASFRAKIVKCLKKNRRCPEFKKSSKKILLRILESSFYQNINDQNFELFFVFLDSIKSLILDFAKSDLNFKNQFFLFKIEFQLLILSNFKECLQAFIDLEGNFKAYNLENDLNKILEGVCYCALQNETRQMIEKMKSVRYEKLLLDPTEIRSILSYYFEIKSKINEESEEHKIFAQFTKEINNLEGK